MVNPLNKFCTPLSGWHIFYLLRYELEIISSKGKLSHWSNEKCNMISGHLVRISIAVRKANNAPCVFNSALNSFRAERGLAHTDSLHFLNSDGNSISQNSSTHFKPKITTHEP